MHGQCIDCLSPVRDHRGKSRLINPIAVLWPAVNPVRHEAAITKQLRKLPLDI